MDVTTATSKIEAKGENKSDTLLIKNGDVEVENKGNATWTEGSNTLTVKVTDALSPTVSTTYTVTVYKPSSDKAITSFVIGEAEGVIDESNHTIAVEVEQGTDVTTLSPTIVVSANASVSPESGVETDFTSPVTYTVTAEDTTTQAYTVTVTYTAPEEQ